MIHTDLRGSRKHSPKSPSRKESALYPSSVYHPLKLVHSALGGSSQEQQRGWPVSLRQPSSPGAEHVSPSLQSICLSPPAKLLLLGLGARAAAVSRRQLWLLLTNPEGLVSALLPFKCRLLGRELEGPSSPVRYSPSHPPPPDSTNYAYAPLALWSFHCREGDLLGPCWVVYGCPLLGYPVIRSQWRSRHTYIQKSCSGIVETKRRGFHEWL